MDSLIWTCAVVLVMASQPVVGQEGVLEPRPPEWDGGSAGMVILYQMQNGFLNNLQKKTIGELIVEYDIQTFADLSSDEFLNNWSEWILYGIGYLVCISIGILLIFILPCTGCGICCSRSCKCCACCCKTPPKNKDDIKKWKGKRIGFSATLACLTAILFASVVCGFVACGQIKKQVEPYGFLDTILHGLYTVDDYVASTSQELDTELLVPIGESIDDLNTTITYFPQLIVTSLGNNVGMLPDLVYFQEFGNSLHALVGNLTVLNGSRSTLQELAPKLNAELVAEHPHLTAVLSQCLDDNVPLCGDLYGRITGLVVSTNYTSLPDISIEIGLISDEVHGTMLVDDINTGANGFWNISIIVAAALGSTLTDIQLSLGNFEQGVTDSITEMQKALLGINLTDAEHMIWEFKPMFNEYGSYTYWGLIGIMAICTLIVFCYTMGLILGLVLPSPSTDSKRCSCTAKHGSSFLLAGIGLTLVFSWLLMLIIIVTFAGGGLAENNLCRHIVIYDESMDELEKLLMHALNLDYNITMKGAMLSCQQNQSLYEAASLEANGYNITQLVDLGQYGIYDMLNRLRNATIPFAPPPPIITPTINASMLTISAALGALNPKLNKYETELAMPITIEDLPLYVADLQNLTTQVSDSVLQSAIKVEIGHLNSTLTGVYQTIFDEWDEMNSSLDVVTTTISMFELPEGLHRLAAADAALAANGSAAMEKAQDDMADYLQALMEALSASIDQAVRYHIGRCRVLFDAGTSMVDGACVYLLQPVNALWFCLGWFMIFSILAVAFGNELAHLFGAFGASHKIGVGSAVYIQEYDEYQLNYKHPGNYEHYTGPVVTPAVTSSGPMLPPKSGVYAPPTYVTHGSPPPSLWYGTNRVSPYNEDEDAYLRS